MSTSNKLLLKQRVLTSGSGSGRAVLDYDSGLIYSYSEPDRIIGAYESGKGWITVKAPYYNQGGWGRHSSGDHTGYKLVENARSLVRAIGGTLYELNCEEFLTGAELNKLNKEIETNNRLIKKQNIIAASMRRQGVDLTLKTIETFNLSLEFKGSSCKGINPIDTALKFTGASRVFLERKGKTVKVESYTVSRDVIKQGSTVVAFRDSSGAVFMNSQVLGVSNFERNFLGNQSLIQSEVRKVAKYSIPFNVLASADLKLSETKVLEQGPEGTYKVKTNQWRSETVERHFTGALLLENSGRKFLMDIDRIEIQHQLFNAFFVEVSPEVSSIAEAYESMKPQAVRDAEASGIEVKRQGEWFFIDANKTVKVLSENVKTYEPDVKGIQKPIVLKRAVAHGKGRPNNLYKPVGFGELDELVCGTVSHQGREHADLDLGTDEVTSSGNGDYTTFKLWHLVPNTTVSNFTINGDID